ncbi:MAG: hypothetical protein ACKO96_03640 [Flammeovirgaceae bacterium]
MKNLKDIKAEFKELVENIPQYLNALKNELSIVELEFNENEVKNIENWFKSLKPDAKTEDIKKMFFSYCSSAFIKSNGGEIILDTKKKSISFGEPIIINYGGKDYPWVAISIFGWMRIIETRGLKRPLSETILRNLKDKTD